MRIVVVAILVVALAGAALLALADGLAAHVVGLALLLLAGVGGAEAAFFAVGRGEDRQRARDARRRR
jgi:hypothetical protein